MCARCAFSAQLFLVISVYSAQGAQCALDMCVSRVILIAATVLSSPYYDDLIALKKQLYIYSQGASDMCA